MSSHPIKYEQGRQDVKKAEETASSTAERLNKESQMLLNM